MLRRRSNENIARCCSKSRRVNVAIACEVSSVVELSLECVSADAAVTDENNKTPDRLQETRSKSKNTDRVEFMELRERTNSRFLSKCPKSVPHDAIPSPLALVEFKDNRDARAAHR
jgi:hypothetical protein